LINIALERGELLSPIFIAHLQQMYSVAANDKVFYKNHEKSKPSKIIENIKDWQSFLQAIR